MAKKHKNRENKENQPQSIDYAHLEETVKKKIYDKHENVPNIGQMIKEEIEDYMSKFKSPLQIAQTTINGKKAVKENVQLTLSTFIDKPTRKVSSEPNPILDSIKEFILDVSEIETQNIMIDKLTELDLKPRFDMKNLKVFLWDLPQEKQNTQS